MISKDKWVEEHCECGVDSHGKWSATLFEEFGCDCNPSEEDADDR